MSSNPINNINAPYWDLLTRDNVKRTKENVLKNNTYVTFPPIPNTNVKNEQPCLINDVLSSVKSLYPWY